MKKELLIVTLLFYSCSLFRKTSRTKDVVTQSSRNQLDFGQVVLKSADKETRIFTYWNDSSFYQYQNVKEQVNKAETNQWAAKAQHKEEQMVAAKNTTSVQAWVVISLVVIIIVFSLFYRG